jgi:hypothetical protein
LSHPESRESLTTGVRRRPTVAATAIKEERMEHTTTQTAHDNSRTIGVVAVVAAVAAGAISNFGNLVNHGSEDGGTVPFLVGAAVAVALGAFLFLRVVPRAKGSARVALVLAGLSVVSLVAYWAGLPEVFGAAAILVALGGRRSAASTMAIVLASGAVVVGVIAALFG